MPFSFPADVQGMIMADMHCAPVQILCCSGNSLLLYILRSHSIANPDVRLKRARARIGTLKQLDENQRAWYVCEN
jgi:hypothetical protein